MSTNTLVPPLLLDTRRELCLPVSWDGMDAATRRNLHVVFWQPRELLLLAAVHLDEFEGGRGNVEPRSTRTSNEINP